MDKWKKTDSSPLDDLKRGIDDLRRKKVCNSLLPQFMPMITTRAIDGKTDDIEYYRYKLMEAMRVPSHRIKELND